MTPTQSKQQPTEKPPEATFSMNGDLPEPPTGYEQWGIARRVAWLHAHMPTPPKNGHAEVQTRSGSTYSYDYVTEPDMMHVVRRWCGSLGVAIFPSAPLVARDENLVSVSMQFKLACEVERGDSVHTDAEVVEYTADGTDMGDKAINKAYTTCMRYFLQKTFQIETDGVDPEKDNEERTASRPAQRGPGRAPARDRKVSKGQAGLIRGRAHAAGLSSDDRDLVIRSVTSAEKVEDVNVAMVDKLLGVFQWIKDNPQRAEAQLQAYREQQADAAATSGVPADANQPQDDPDAFVPAAAEATHLCISCGINAVDAEGGLCQSCEEELGEATGAGYGS